MYKEHLSSIKLKNQFFFQFNQHLKLLTRPQLPWVQHKRGALQQAEPHCGNYLISSRKNVGEVGIGGQQMSFYGSWAAVLLSVKALNHLYTAKEMNK